MEKTHASITAKRSPFSRYQSVLVGRRGVGAFLYFEFCAWLSPIPGALGMVLRKIFWPKMFGSCGPGCMFARNIVVRHPWRIHMGERVVISENCVLDGRHTDESDAIVLGNDVILSNDVMLSCKQGTIRIGDDTGINAQTIIQSTNGCPVVIGEDCILGQRCLVIGGGSYITARLDVPIRKQGIRDDGGVHLERNVWLGAGVTVLGGVRVGEGSIAAAGAILTRSVVSETVCMGVPARPVKRRSDP